MKLFTTQEIKDMISNKEITNQEFINKFNAEIEKLKEMDALDYILNAEQARLEGKQYLKY